MKRHAPPPDIERDPFHEREARLFSWRTNVLGARLEFSSERRELLHLAQQAFDGVPRHQWSRGARPILHVRMKCVPGATSAWARPPKPVLSSGAGLLSGHVDANNFVIVDPGAARALIQVGERMLRHPRLLRYELIEFAAITLATRTHALVPLHAGCLGARGRGVLLLGASGSGKSTLALHAALGGLDFLAEDSVFVENATLRATGLSAFVHARKGSLALIEDRRARQALRRAPGIERRSGVRKHEIDLRNGLARLAPKPLRIVATVVLSARAASGPARLAPLSTSRLRRTLRAEQAYARTQPGWSEFERKILRVEAFSLPRVPPGEGVALLRKLLGSQS